MISRRLEVLCDPVLIDLNIPHGFGRRGSQVPESTAFPQQVHGVRVVEAAAWEPDQRPPADAILSTPGQPEIGIVTADCVPILAACLDGAVVVAIHAGWRGLAAGVIEAGMQALQARVRGQPLIAAIGPAARGCCYEVDDPVRQALSERYPHQLEPPVLAEGRAGHFQLDLPALAIRILESVGVVASSIGTTHCVCTICDAQQFESYRRDGPAAGRLSHFIAGSCLRNLSGRVDSLGGPP
ncbi:MAG: polyphenol oxidase family protein [Myxococcota bacterium]